MKSTANITVSNEILKAFLPSSAIGQDGSLSPALFNTVSEIPAREIKESRL